ncbi:MAG: TrmH family RNA methyltransferase [Tepidisphaeraceae bacterium]
MKITHDLQRVESLDDPRLAPYRNLKDRDLSRDSNGARFIAEGEHVVRRLLASDFPIESVFLAQRRVAELAPFVPANVPVYAVPDELSHRVVGYKFHSGVLACGRRKPSPTLDDVVPRDGPVTLVVCPEIANTENLGGLIRLSAGFGATAMVLGERSCDPFFRQSVRVSMGTVFRLPIVQSRTLLSDLRRLRNEFSVELFATVLDADAEPLDRVRSPSRAGLLFGNEAQGLASEHVAACDRHITIPMRLGTDSLNVAVSAGIFLYHFTRRTMPE